MRPKYIEACNTCARYYDKCPWCGEARPPDPRLRKPKPAPDNKPTTPTVERVNAHEIARLILSTIGKGPL